MRILTLKALAIIGVVMFALTGHVFPAIMMFLFGGFWILERCDITHFFHDQNTYKFSRNYF